MSHCAPEATLKPKRFEFTLETVITDVFVAQVYREAVPKTWPGGSKASVAKCVRCASVDTICWWTSGADVLNLPKPSVCRQPITECGSRGGRCMWQKVVPACSYQASSYLFFQTMLLHDVSFSHKTHRVVISFSALQS